MKKGELVLVHLADTHLELTKGNKTTPVPAIVVSVWENEYPTHPKCKDGVNVRVFTDSNENPLWISSLPMYFDGIRDMYESDIASFEVMAPQFRLPENEHEVEAWEKEHSDDNHPDSFMPPPEGVSRRNCLWLLTKEEKACYDLVSDIEKMTADTRLSLAQCRIQEAKDLIADFVDGITRVGA